MRNIITTIIGKAVSSIAKLRGGGSAFPGLVVEKIDSHYISRILSQLPHGVILISGTNGKTTTTKIVVELLEGQGLKVFTNRTGSNFVRGVISALLSEVSLSGKINKDIAVLELDEAHATHFVKKIKPTYSLLLNVLRDQLDRFGEIDYTASLLHTVAKNTSSAIVINRDDPRLGSQKFIKSIRAKYRTYGVSDELKNQFPADDILYGGETKTDIAYNDDTSLEKISKNKITVKYTDKCHNLRLQLAGIYNMQNTVGAIAMTRLVMGDNLNEQQMFDNLENIQPAFGRGENITINGHPCEIVLVKNPSGFRLSLSSFDPKDYKTMIAINDEYADGRDVSWLWDVNFSSLKEHGVAVVSGVRAYDMALKLDYEDIKINHISTNLAKSLHDFINNYSENPKRIYCTYTAMLAIRKYLIKLSDNQKVKYDK